MSKTLPTNDQINRNTCKKSQLGNPHFREIDLNLLVINLMRFFFTQCTENKNFAINESLKEGGVETKDDLNHTQYQFNLIGHQ
jgi:hypothetical protein